MSRSVDDLRTELKSLGYLSHGLERWFAHDPWKSGTFWTELAIVSSKASLVIALFATVAALTVMLLRNGGLPPFESLAIGMIYLLSSFLASMVVHVLVALALKWNPTFGVENPRALMMIAMMISGFLCLWLVAWWSAFPSEPAAVEQIVFIVLLLLLFSAASVVSSAALLSFSIHESRSIPRIHRKSRTIPLTTGAILLLAMILGLSMADAETNPQPEAPQIVVRPTTARVALIAVDGLTPALFRLRPELNERLSLIPAEPLHSRSAPEAWATVGTGTSAALHGVQSVEGIRFAGSGRVIQNVSQLDHGLRVLAPATSLAERQPLPPSVRNRHYVWEILAGRGVPSTAVNWWTSDEANAGPLHVVTQETIFSLASAAGEAPAELALEIDRLAIESFTHLLDQHPSRFATIYLPALDVILNRLEVGEQTKLAGTIRALDQIVALSESLERSGWTLIIVGTPGDGEGDALIATDLTLDEEHPSLHDLAPTILSLFGFPPSLEMPGSPLIHSAQRITSYGPRLSTETRPVSDDYYENLKSLGYIQ